jgi:hypothetical protein
MSCPLAADPLRAIPCEIERTTRNLIGCNGPCCIIEMNRSSALHMKQKGFTYQIVTSGYANL